MANGDSTLTTLLRVKERGGFNSAGAPKQDKEMVVGSLAITYATGGFNVPPSLFGLLTIDHISMTVTSVNAGTLNTGSKLWAAGYLPATNLMLIVDDAANQATAGQAAVASFVVIGTSARAPELL